MQFYLPDKTDSFNIDYNALYTSYKSLSLAPMIVFVWSLLGGIQSTRMPWQAPLKEPKRPQLNPNGYVMSTASKSN